MERVIEEKRCTGCKMCGDLCVEKAIFFPVNSEGFWYPKIDESKCISCDLCRKKCPSNNIIEGEKEFKPKVYAAWIKNEEMRLYSTSGGLYYAFAKQIIETGGCVAACRFSEDWKHAEHIIAEDEEQMLNTVRSKYFQSETEGIYRKVKELLQKGRRVLFCGAPCQSAALQSYLGMPYERLITMDFICRGINSQKAFEAFITELEEHYHSKVCNVHLKNKRKGWTSLGVLVQFENGREYYETRKDSYWSLGYIRDNLYMRPVCHECNYRTIPRISDFTIGDFWGIKEASPKDMFNGISVLMINSSRAKRLFGEFKSELVLQEKKLEDVVKGNPCLLQSPKEGEKRERFFKLLKKMSFSEAVQECCGKLGC